MLRVFRFDAGQRHLVLEFTQMLAWSDDGRADPQHMESRSVLAAVIANLDDVCLTNLVERVSKLVVLLSFLSTYCV